MQDNFLFDGTVAENIAFSKPHATREEIQAVSRIAHVEEFVEKFELKYDTVVGERGVKLSGRTTSAHRHRAGDSGRSKTADSRRGNLQPG
jgi:ABC-type transport system involved in Fe-S cluster assembly fused permease/ATPase subunit